MLLPWDNSTDKLRDHVSDKGVKKSEKFMDVIDGSPLASTMSPFQHAPTPPRMADRNSPVRSPLDDLRIDPDRRYSASHSPRASRTATR